MVGGTVPRDPKAWLFVVTLNTARDLRRRRRHRDGERSLEDEAAMEMQAHEPAPEVGVHRKEALTAARNAIHRLKDNLREVFLLRVSGGLTFEAIAESLAIPVGTLPRYLLESSYIPSPMMHTKAADY